MGYNDLIHGANVAIAKSPVGKYFRLEGSGHAKERIGSSFFTEIRAGLATFFAMAYIISVNATIISQSGGTCVCDYAASAAANPSDGICDTDPVYMQCVQEVKRDLVTGTAAISALTSFCMGLFANMPIALAPGMGLNAYFTFNVVGYHGTGTIPYQTAVTAVFVEGLVFVALSILGIRQWLARAIPRSLKHATGVGIGLYLALIGLTYSAGIGLTVGGKTTPLELAGCVPSALDEDGLCPSSTKMRNPTMWIGIFCGGFLTAMLMLFRFKGAIMVGILLVSIISWPRTTSLTYFPYTDAGNDSFDFFKKVVTFHPIQRVLAVQDWNISEHGGSFAIAFITFLYVDILDCTGTMYAMARYCGAIDEETQDFEGSAIAYLVDAWGVTIGSLFGTSPVTAYVESGAGISEGGATGLTAMVTGLCFFLSIFFAPIFASFPPWATGPTLVIVGSLMIKAAADINWKYMGDAIPAFLTIILMPFTYSIAYGLIGGILTYILINVSVSVVERISGRRWKPKDKEEKEFWTYKLHGGLLPPWVSRAARGQRRFWKADEEAHGAAPPETLTGKEAGVEVGAVSPHRSSQTSDEAEKARSSKLQ